MDSYEFFPTIFSPQFQPQEMHLPLPQFQDMSSMQCNSERYQPVPTPFGPLDDFSLYSTDNDGYSSPSLNSLVELETIRSFSSASSASSASGSPEHYSSNGDDEYIPEHLNVSMPTVSVSKQSISTAKSISSTVVKTESAPRKATKRKKSSPSPVAPVAIVDTNEVVEDAAAKRRRLLRKAELARLSRKRKKTKLSDLEDQVKRLQDELAKAREQIQQPTSRSASPVKIQQSIPSISPNPFTSPVDASVGAKDLLSVSLAPLPITDDAEKANIETTIRAIIDRKINGIDNEDGSSSEPSLHSLLEHFALLHLRRATYADVHLSSLQNILTPSIPLQFLSWIMTQPDAPAMGYNASNSSLYSSLFYDQLGIVTDEQKVELNALRTTIRKQHKWDAEMRKAWHKLDSSVRKSMKQQNENLERLRSILTEEQMQKYLAWVKQYGEVCLKI